MSEEVKLKALEWDEIGSPNKQWRAKSNVGDYTVVQRDHRFLAWRRDGDHVRELGYFPNEADAIGAAQADFEQRIRAAIADPAPQPATSTVGVEPVAWRYRGGTGAYSGAWYVSATKPFTASECEAGGWEQQALGSISDLEAILSAALEDKKRAVEERDVALDLLKRSHKATALQDERFARLKAEVRAEKAEAALRAIIICTHRPNPTDPSRIDVAPGKHRAFQEAIERGAALTKERSE